MFERLTESGIKVIMLAQEESRRLGHNFVGTEQLLLGIIGEGRNFSAKALINAGANLKSARLEVEKIIGRGNGRVAVEIPFTPSAKRVLEQSWEEARELGSNFIGPEHLLLAILTIKEGVAIKVLDNLSVDIAALRNRVSSEAQISAGRVEHSQTLGRLRGDTTDIETTIATFRTLSFTLARMQDAFDRLEITIPESNAADVLEEIVTLDRRLGELDNSLAEDPVRLRGAIKQLRDSIQRLIKEC